MTSMWKKAWTSLLVLLALCAFMSAAAADDTVVLPEKLKIIAQEAFLNNTGLNHVVVPDGTQEIGSRAFAGSSVKSIFIPASVTVISDDAFQGVTGLTVTGDEGSYAQEYCLAHSIPFTVPQVQPYPESAHPYEDNTDQTWSWTGRPDTRLLRIHFGNVILERNSDWLYVYDASGNLLRGHTGELPYGCEMVIPGNSFSLRLVADEGTSYYGFSILSIEELTSYTETPLKITRINAPASPSVASNSNSLTWNVEVEGTFTPFSFEYQLMRADVPNDHIHSTDFHYRNFQIEWLRNPGMYTMHVTVMDSLGRTVSAVSDPIVVMSSAPLAVASLTTDLKQSDAGDELTWTTAFEHAVYPVSVEYVVSRDGVEVSREVHGVSYKQENDVYTYTAVDSGNHTLTFTATDAAGQVVSGSSEPVYAEGRWTPIISITADCTETIIGQPITWTAVVENADGPIAISYDVYMNGKRETFFDTELSPDGTLTCTYTPDEAGDWSLHIAVGAGDVIVRQASENVRVTKDLGEKHGDFFYQINDANEATITHYAGTDDYVLIPETIAGAPVVAIADEAFAMYYNDEYMSNSVIAEVAIPDSVKSIGARAFYQCPNLHTVDFGCGVTTVGYDAFNGCTSLRKITYPRALSADSSVPLFQNCPSLKSVVVPGGVATLPANVFYNATGLENITLPSSLTTLKGNVFNGCTSLKAVELPDGVTSIGSGAFYNCSSLTSFHYPRSLESIGSDAFVGCTNLELITIADSVQIIPDEAFSGCEGLREVQCPSSLEEIGRAAFEDCINLTTVILREGLITVGSSAFSGCTSLKAIDLPNSVEVLDGGVFAYCSSLESIHLPTQWNWSSSNNFYECTSLTTIVLPEGMQMLPEDAFLGAAYLEEVYLPKSLEEIGEYAFSGCSSLRDIHFQEGLRKINAFAFYSCVSLKEADLPNSVEHIRENIFEGCLSLESFHYPLNWNSTFVSSSWPYNIYAAFQVVDCPKLTRIVVPEGVTSIPHFALSGCDQLEEIVLPDSLLEIQDGAFSDCTNLRKINIPGSVVYIGENVLSNCPRLNITCEWGSPGDQFAQDNYYSRNYLTLHEGRYPKGTLPLGEKFSFGGTLYSCETIHSMTAHIYNADGSRLVQGTIAAPYATEADLADCFNDEFRFEDLPAGRYLFRLKVVVNGSAEKVLVENTFDVAAPIGGEGLEITNLLMPNGTLREGYEFLFEGTFTFDLSSTDAEASIEIAIVDDADQTTVMRCILATGDDNVIELKKEEAAAANGNTETEETDTQRLMRLLKFSELKPGLYACRITATLGYNQFLAGESHFRISPASEDPKRAEKVDRALLQSSTNRSDDLIYESVILSDMAYDVNQAISNLEALGFQEVAFYSIEPGAHTIGHFIGWKDILDDNGNAVRAYAILCRGTIIHLNEWLSNFTLASPNGYHHGFYQAASEVLRHFEAYVGNHCTQPWEPDKYKVWVMGHSRGAAVANILGGDLLIDAGYARSNVSTYTFACPNVYKGSAPTVKNVFNFNLAGDLVPRVPVVEWGYSRYGSTDTFNNGDRGFGLDLMNKDSADFIAERLAEVNSVDLLESTFNKALQDLDELSVFNIWRCYLTALHELLSDVGLSGETYDLSLWLDLISDVFTTHSCTTYIEWISDITGN